MNEHLSLVVFTFLTQVGIGLMAVAQVLGGDGRLTETAMILSLCITAISLLVVFLHLGRPLGAYRTIFNLKSSWLSRETFFLGGYMILGVIRMYAEWQGELSLYSSGIGWLMFLSGILCLISMASIYSNTAIPIWEGQHTHVTFYCTALSFGAVLYAAVAANVAPQVDIRTALVLSGIGVLVQMSNFIIHYMRQSARVGAQQASIEQLAKNAYLLVASQIFILAGGLILPLLAYAAGREREGIWLYAACGTLAVGQLIARYLYYTTGVHAMASGWADIIIRQGDKNRGSEW